MKKFLTILMVAATLFNVLPRESASAVNEEVSIVAQEFKEVNGTKQVKAVVRLKNISFNTFQLTLRYDTSRLELSNAKTNEPATNLRDSIENIEARYSGPKNEGWMQDAFRQVNTSTGSLDYSIYADPSSKGIPKGSDDEGFINANENGMDLFSISFKVKDGKKLTDKSIRILDDKLPEYNAANPTGVASHTKDGDVINFIKNIDLSKVAEEKEPEQVLPPVDGEQGGQKPGDFTDSELTPPELEDKPNMGLSDINGHWANADIKNLVEKGIINGYSDGTFKPEKSLTRAEFSVVMVKALGLATSKDDKFNDTKGHWANESINAMANAGFIQGSDGKFRPNDSISRQELITIIGRAKSLSKPDKIEEFLDHKEISPWAVDFVYAAKEQQIVSGYPDGTIKPNKNVTRAEMAKIVSDILSK